jgi:hypothetical protein
VVLCANKGGLVPGLELVWSLDDGNSWYSPWSMILIPSHWGGGGASPSQNRLVLGYEGWTYRRDGLVFFLPWAG